ncbi:hypothetical protein KXQ82_01155 [Mucilaginibacter sp. HMF5004]|uniref:hypothetical protein n=1 Tax=Mucilaginibacter rivuli TaxID=2857527 RepID=UPI001C5CD36D|nr:hypothetical protein [Mucilaginibacter rivuli]MBW4888297.1 hypothetical protein [Mucilaginibacter rivuli]
MKRVFTNLLTLLFLLSCAAGYAQKTTKAKISNIDTISIDLALSNTAPLYQIANKKPVVVVIHNLLPNGHYTINQTRSLKLSGTLPVPATAATGGIDPCTGLEQALRDAKTETEFGQLMAIAKNNNCEFYEKYLSVSTSDPITVSKLNNEVFTLTVTNSDTRKEWTLTIQTEESGQFVTVYGFTYIPFALYKPHTHFAQQNRDASGAPLGTYTITPASSESLAQYAPTVAFHYITKQSGTLSSSFTAGLGVALNSSSPGISPIVIAGYSLLYNQNMGINFGIAAHQMTNLKGQFTSGQVIATSLQEADLNEQVTRFNPFVSIIFRFGSSPFSAKKTPTNTTGTLSSRSLGSTLSPSK